MAMHSRILMGMLALLLVSFSLMAGQNEFRMITLKHRFAEDILPIVQPMVGESGTANAMDNHLIIRTTPDRMAAIEQVVAQFDVAHRNIRIEISHENNMQMEGSRATISGGGRIDNGEIVIGDRPPRRSGATLPARCPCRARGARRSSRTWCSHRRAAPASARGCTGRSGG